MNVFLYKDVPVFNAYISLSPELSFEMETRVADRLSVFKQNMFYYQSSSDGDIKKMKEKIKHLEQALVNSELRATALEMMIEVAEKELKINIRKKSNTKPSSK